MVPLVRETLYPFDQVSEEVNKLYYASIIGHLLYPSIIMRPDIAFAAAKLSQFSYNPLKQHIAAAEAYLEYAYIIRYLFLHYSAAEEDNVLSCSTDALFADDIETRKLSQGFIFKLFGGPVL